MHQSRSTQEKTKKEQEGRKREREKGKRRREKHLLALTRSAVRIREGGRGGPREEKTKGKGE